ncbi:hypothetical protein [Brevundimonas aveniformis]|uniref:hypothetical protein n=1 Tax=Brevundimonas aveniformis TaxID=370977 RepID=UPI0024922AD9|nr:hypothetical protein [Brevundimonas aveniformis]
MIRVLILATVGTMALTACAPVQDPNLGYDADGIRVCDLTVSFGSYAMGVDQELKSRILTLVAQEPGLDNTEERPWGREGESNLCIHAPRPGQADRLYDQIAEMIPTYSERAPTTVTHRDGRSEASVMPPWRN